MTGGEYQKGKKRYFLSTSKSPTIISKSNITKIDHALIFVLLVASSLIRLYNLPYPDKVVFDEVHFGGFAREYAWGDFHLDVHPPLAKLIFFFIAISLGWDGKFDFAEIGTPYPEGVPYLYMRLFPAICGILTVLLTFGLLRLSGCRSVVAFFGASLVMVENSLVTQSRFILLDLPLLLGISLTLFAYKKFQVTIPFSKRWHKFLILTGLGLGITISTKWSGLFTMAVIGSLTALELWLILGDLQVSMKSLIRHFISRFVGFVLIPLTIYLGCFAAHFALLPNGGLNSGGSGKLSPEFKSTLIDNDVDWENLPVEVSFGSTITLKHFNLGSYLHSHNATYQTGTQKQQVTLYGFDPDPNNEWIMEMKQRLEEGDLQRKIRPIKDGDVIRLLHRETGKFLHVDDVRPPISEEEYNNEVNCEGSKGMDPYDGNYEWKVRIVQKRSTLTDNNLPMIKVRATELVFQLVHVGTKCVLNAHLDKLPSWAFKQLEVFCTDEPTLLNTFWYVEYNSHPKLDAGVKAGTESKINLRPYSFLDKFLEIQHQMWRQNEDITDYHEFSSQPETWPFLSRGVSYLKDQVDHQNIYFLGNVPIYYGGFIAILWVLVQKVIYFIGVANPFVYGGVSSDDTKIFQSASFEFLLGWIFNYIPYFNMSRQKFLHHYLPALYFSILVLTQVVEYQYAKRRWFASLLMITIGGSAGYCLYNFAPIVYGTFWNPLECLTSRWFVRWDVDCSVYI